MWGIIDDKALNYYNIMHTQACEMAMARSVHYFLIIQQTGVNYSAYM